MEDGLYLGLTISDKETLIYKSNQSFSIVLNIYIKKAINFDE